MEWFARLATSPTGVLVVMLIVVAVAAAVALRTWLRDRPRRRSTARDRLLRRNPWLDDAVDQHRWSARSNHVRIGWLTVLLVAVAVLAAADRSVAPVATGGAVDDR